MMGANTKIEWCDFTFNCWRGCTKVSPGCKNCYAETLSGRNPKTLGVWGPQGTRVVAAESAWREPLKWDREAKRDGVRRRVFCASLADVFEDWRGPMLHASGYKLHHGFALSDSPRWIESSSDSTNTLVTMDDVRRRLFALIDATPNLDWLVLTKRPENIAKMMPEYVRTSPSENWFFDPEEQKRRGLTHAGPHKSTMSVSGVGVVRPNLWLGTSVENQAAADERIPHLLRTPAAVRFLSCEPLLGPVDLDRAVFNGQSQGLESEGIPGHLAVEVAATFKRLDGLHWCIVGGESGHGARPFHVEWARSLVKQCKAAGVACFVKQLGSNYADENNGICGKATKWPHDVLPSGPFKRLADAKGGDIEEFPADLRVREFPEARTP